MLTVAEALAAITRETTRFAPARVKLADALGLILAADAVSDLDSPPFDKALMDGYAVRAADVGDPATRLFVVDEVLAGQVSQKRVGPGEAIRIMTGAPIPVGADAVVAVERTRLEEGADQLPVVVIELAELALGKNILKQGESTRQGTRVVSAGSRLRAQEIGALAELGQAHVAVYPAPRVAVLATGDELVSVDQVPGPGQIRNSNESMLVAQLRQMGAVPEPLGVARDQASNLRESIDLGLSHDVLLLSGGVSAGKLDLVPSVLAEAGVRQVFHKVQVKPGQPIWFGVREASSSQTRQHSPDSRTHQSSPGSRTRQSSGGVDDPNSGEFSDGSGGNSNLQSGPCYVFGLPGNPVSSMVCCELFVRTAIRKLMGIEPAVPMPMRGRLTRDHINMGNRPTYFPARWEWTEQGGSIEPVKWVGSADLSATVEANALAVFSEGDRKYSAGSVIDVILL